MSQLDTKFAGSIPALYDEYLVPLIFQPYAEDLARRVLAHRPARVLELAAGTGVLTRQLARLLPDDTEIVATDLNPAMIEEAQRIGTVRPVQWRCADATRLPFEAHSFDAVVCQFGIMFFPDKPACLAGIRQVLRPGGHLLFNTWDRIEDNEFAQVVTDALADLYPNDPPRFLARTPHGYFDADRILQDLADGGFPPPADVATVSFTSRADTARTAALAYCQGTPLRNEIESRDPTGVEAATDVAEAALVRRFGTGPIEGRIQALVAEAGV